jgi:hypothetical protein
MAEFEKLWDSMGNEEAEDLRALGGAISYGDFQEYWDELPDEPEEYESPIVEDLQEEVREKTERSREQVPRPLAELGKSPSASDRAISMRTKVTRDGQWGDVSVSVVKRQRRRRTHSSEPVSMELPAPDQVGQSVPIDMTLAPMPKVVEPKPAKPTPEVEQVVLNARAALAVREFGPDAEEVINNPQRVKRFFELFRFGTTEFIANAIGASPEVTRATINKFRKTAQGKNLKFLQSRNLPGVYYMSRKTGNENLLIQDPGLLTALGFPMGNDQILTVEERVAILKFFNLVQPESITEKVITMLSEWGSDDLHAMGRLARGCGREKLNMATTFKTVISRLELVGLKLEKGRSGVKVQNRWQQGYRLVVI